MDIANASSTELTQWLINLERDFAAFKQQNIRLDLTRGKPSAEQLSLSDALDGCLEGNYSTEDGLDTRNYGGLNGIPQSRQLGAEILGVKMEEVSAQGNSSLTLMYLTALFAKEFGLRGADSAWKNNRKSLSFICPVPGYDRHFSICEHLGIDMITVPMLADGPDMDAVETLIANDPSIVGMWCVPKYSNPTGVIYSDANVERIAKLGQRAAADFLVFWDNAYAIHDLNGFKPLANIMDYCRQHGTESSVIQFASTSKISHAGSGVAYIAASVDNLAGFHQHLGVMSIGPDKVNQLRHAKLFPDYSALQNHMQDHAGVLKPRFDCVLKHLQENFSDNDLGEWETAEGGYFISFDSRPGLAKQIVTLAAELGVKLTPAGATFPYGKDPQDRNIRIAPSVPNLEEVEQAMAIFVLCVKLASLRQAIAQ